MAPSPPHQNMGGYPKIVKHTEEKVPVQISRAGASKKLPSHCAALCKIWEVLPRKLRANSNYNDEVLGGLCKVYNNTPKRWRNAECRVVNA